MQCRYSRIPGEGVISPQMSTVLCETIYLYEVGFGRCKADLIKPPNLLYSFCLSSILDLVLSIFSIVRLSKFTTQDSDTTLICNYRLYTRGSHGIMEEWCCIIFALWLFLCILEDGPTMVNLRGLFMWTYSIPLNMLGLHN